LFDLKAGSLQRNNLHDVFVCPSDVHTEPSIVSSSPSKAVFGQSLDVVVHIKGDSKDLPPLLIQQAISRSLEGTSEELGFLQVKASMLTLESLLTLLTLDAKSRFLTQLCFASDLLKVTRRQIQIRCSDKAASSVSGKRCL
jgi:hypothetical protein